MKIGLYIHNKQANVLRFVRCLNEWGLDFVSVPRADLLHISSADFDVLLLHGGWYGIDRTPGQNQHTYKSSKQDKQRGDAVREFVRQGGGIVGVCAGAFNVVWLDLIQADISRASGVGLHALEVVQPDHPIAQPVLEKPANNPDRAYKAVPVIRFNGPIFFPKDPEQLVFSYDWEQRLGAVLAGNYGNGRAVAISPHPERTEHDLGKEIRIEEPLMPVAKILREAILWSASDGKES